MKGQEFQKEKKSTFNWVFANFNMFVVLEGITFMFVSSVKCFPSFLIGVAGSQANI